MSIFDNFRHISLTEDQRNALIKIRDFLSGDENVFILQGYAGSGKTTLLKGLVDYFHSLYRKCQLMAPTGRAAKVINQKTGFEATTIHKGIYSFDELEEIEANEEESTDVSFRYYYKLQNNMSFHDYIYIVDEASMVSDIQSQGEFFRFGSGFLLKDLIEYSHTLFPNSSSKIIFIGDPAQLPPIGMTFSPALQKKYLEEKYSLRVCEAEIREVKRQNADNGILVSAAKIRKCLTSGFFNDFDLRGNGRDIFNPEFKNFLETYKSQHEKKIIISYKNKTALDLNQTIRRDKYGDDLTIQSGDIIIVGGNNYLMGVMNGEFGVVASVENVAITREVRFYRKNGVADSVLLTWRRIELMMPGENGQGKTVRGYMIENYLNGDNYLKPEEQQALYVDFKIRHPKLKPKTEEFREAIKSDLWFNCILLKYGYAVTCHKAQGGEWDTALVFWDKGVKEDFNFYSAAHNRSGKTNPEFYRWAYTAITRASGKLFCINPPYFNSFSGMSFIDFNVRESYRELTGKSLQPIEIDVSGDNYILLQHFNIENAPLPIQNHLLRLYNVVKSRCIDIISWKKVGYEIRYIFKRENDIAAFKFWINGRDEFKTGFQRLPSETNSDSLFEEISKLTENAPEFVFTRNTIDSVLSRIEFEIDLEEEKPFLKVLFDSLHNQLAESRIAVGEINHQEYRERYTFVKGDERAVIDFEYNGNGFFGRVIPIENRCNSHHLLDTIRKAVSNLKVFEHAV